jgi:hypothetical protein
MYITNVLHQINIMILYIDFNIITQMGIMSIKIIAF